MRFAWPLCLKKVNTPDNFAVTRSENVKQDRTCFDISVSVFSNELSEFHTFK